MSQELELIGLEIAKQCKGVPLAAKVIAGTLCNVEMSHAAWLKIQNSNIGDSLESVLKLSFDHLSSPSVKKCFAYCAMFPKDYRFEKGQLIELWMAEGFLGSSMEMMDIGNRYLNELLSNSLFQDVEKDACGNILAFKMHDLLHDMALSVSGSDTLIFKEPSTSTRNEVSHIRHLNIAGELLPSFLTAVAPKLHSLISEIDVFKNRSRCFTSLRVLNFSGADYIFELPTSIGELKRLRYLDISNTFIKELPRSITKLYSLKTLRFLDCRLMTFPDGLRNLISLKHIHYDHERSQPIELSRLTSLQTLPMFFMGLTSAHSTQSDSLKNLNELCGELKLCNLERVRDEQEANGANLQSKGKLYKVIFEWDWLMSTASGAEEVMEGLQPHSNLKSLIVRNYRGARFPSWMLRPVHGSNTGLLLLDNLMELEFVDCINCESLPPLGQLRNLQFLTLKNLVKLKCMGDEFCCNQSSDRTNEVFPALKKFTLHGMTSLEEWTSIAATTMFPCLEELYISECHRLKSVPLTGSCATLVKLCIGWCPELSYIGDRLAASTNLKELTIWGCSNLCQLPNLKGFSTLRSLYVSHCKELKSIPITGAFSSLEKLRISRCKKLSKIGDGLSTSTCLKELDLSRCPELSSIPDLEGFSSLQSLSVDRCAKLKVLPIAGRCSSLKMLVISWCKKLSKIGDGLSTSTCLKELDLFGCPELSSIPDLEGFSSLQSLSVNTCDKLEVLPIAGRCSSLQKLWISWCKKLSKIGDGLSTSTCLKELQLNSCPNLTSIPNLEGFSSLQRLKVSSCNKLQRFPIKAPLSSLKELSIMHCPNLKPLPCIDGLSSLTALDFTNVGKELSYVLPNLLRSTTCLSNLTISHSPDLISIPEGLGGLHSLYRLEIMSCPRLRSIPDDILSSLNRLEYLAIGGFSKRLQEFTGLNSIRHLCASLRVLCLIGWENLKSLPHQLQHLSALKDLRIQSFQGIEALPEWLGKLSSLQYLEITSCDNLMYLPSVDVMRNLSNLERFHIARCPLLKPRCSKESGPEWSKISHIPRITFDNQM